MPPPLPPRPPQPPRLARLLYEDWRRGGMCNTLRRDLHALYDFYLDEPTRARFSRVGRPRRWLSVSAWLVRSLILRLSPARRMLLVAALALFALGEFGISWDGLRIGGSGSTPAFLFLLLVLLLELKDKLLAHDELAVGRAVQTALMPSTSPSLGGWDIWLVTRPANEVGGDLVDYLPLSGDRLALLIGDVSGKGLGAALLMAKLQATVRALAGDGTPLATLGQRVNRILCRDGIKGRFATLLYVELNSGDGRISLLNAGHPPPLVVKASRIESPRPVALPMGARADATFTEQQLEVEPGTLVLLYSDGVTEARNPSREMFGDHRLRALLAGLGQQPAEACGNLLLQTLDAFVGEAPAFDDISLVVLRRLG